MSVRATVGEEIIAESERVIWIEGNGYFPRDAIAKDVLRESDKRTVCHWKGEATYFDVLVGDDVIPDAAWSYPRPKQKAKRIQDRVAFTRKVRVADADATTSSGLTGRLRTLLLGR